LVHVNLPRFELEGNLSINALVGGTVAERAACV
jgi:hypothetical protein